MTFTTRSATSLLVRAISQLGKASATTECAIRCPRGVASAVGGPHLGNVQMFNVGTSPLWAASSANGSGTLVEQMQAKIRDGLGGADEVEVIDVSGDTRHVAIRVVSKAFEGKSSINRQRLVYKCIWEEMQSEQVHAVQGIETKTPDEVAN